MTRYLKPDEMTDEEYEEFMSRCEYYWNMWRNSFEVTFEEAKNHFPFECNRWDDNFEFRGGDIEEMAYHFLTEFSTDIFNAVLEQRNLEDDFYNTNEHECDLCY